MPIQGFPDPEKHRICCVCGQWFEAWEGGAVRPPRAGPVAQIGRTVAGVAGFGLSERFMCTSCQQRQRHRRLVIWLVVLFCVLLVVALFATGLLSWLWAVRRLH